MYIVFSKRFVDFTEAILFRVQNYCQTLRLDHRQSVHLDKNNNHRMIYKNINGFTLFIELVKYKSKRKKKHN